LIKKADGSVIQHLSETVWNGWL